MSVLSCARNGCERIMCDSYSSAHGYICPNCLEELTDYCIIHGVSRATIHSFMTTPIDNLPVDEGSVRQKLLNIFTDY